jgi:hypothetical protein
MAILLQFLQNGQTVDGTDALKVWPGGQKFGFINQAERDALSDLRSRVMHNLERVSPSGRTYYKPLATILMHEKYWVNPRNNRLTGKTLAVQPLKRNP